ncbi:RecT family recombinase [Pseudomonas rhodesiae]|uniref:RecT family recombinase n=2 Tax=Pseudomonas rhodesiae TaxID=76760 RepID=UPI00209F754F|nr:RecT family recombinase [Pseudomonas rhodesiae]MCP1515638.1 recombination protein RecT [Pseudomonas rhodesiae]
MSNQALSPIQVVTSLVRRSEEKFLKMVQSTHVGLNFNAEALYAVQQFSGKNKDFALKIAQSNPSSVIMAMVNVAAVGLTLNPALALAYLVPRDGRIMLDISYRGLVKIATDTGSISWSKSELVYSNDHFKFRGPAQLPVHEFDAFAPIEERGKFRGGYNIAKLPSGDHLVTPVRAEKIFQIRDSSEAFKKDKGPWMNWAEEMYLKTITKRARKDWPLSSPRMDTAMEILDIQNGEGFSGDPDAVIDGQAMLVQAADSVVVPMSSQAPGHNHAFVASHMDIHVVADAEFEEMGHVELKPQFDPSTILPKVLQRIQSVIDRAYTTGCWQAARDWFEEQSGFSRELLQYSLDELDKAQSGAPAQQQSA